MPTGYTHGIYEGEELTAKEFILKCARNFGATVTMRDEPMDKEIPTFEPNDYHLRRLEEAKSSLKKYKAMSINEVQEEIDENYVSDVERYHERKEEYENLESRYLRVLQDVEKWNPPSKDHVNLKEFAIKQLKDSIFFDCNQDYLTYPVKFEATEYLKNKIVQCKKDIEYHQKSWDEEAKRTEERNKWVEQLKESL